MASTKNYDVVMALNYYAPYVSGLTEAARLVAESLAEQGQRVLVVTCRHDVALPRRERINGVHVVRTRVLFRIGKGLISPSFIATAVHFGRRARVLNLHLPMIESGVIATFVRNTRKVLTFQCDIALPPGLVNRLQERVMDASVALAFSMSEVVAPSSEDYAKSSRVAKWMPVGKRNPVSPPTRLQSGGCPAFRSGPGPHIGFLGRLVEEKGLEYLVDGFRGLADPEARLLIAGDYKNVAGGSVIDLVRQRMGDDPRIQLLGFLEDDELADFYASLDIFALPSVNAFEAFGIVQVEAMRVGVAALASDLPGVRSPVLNTGFGVIVAPRDSTAVTRGLEQLIRNPPDRTIGAVRSSEVYSRERTVREYQQLFDGDR